MIENNYYSLPFIFSETCLIYQEVEKKKGLEIFQFATSIHVTNVQVQNWTFKKTFLKIIR